MSTENKISIETFAEYGWFSFKVLDILKENNLTDFFALITFYKRFGNNFKRLEEINIENQYELTAVCKHFEFFSESEIIDEIQNYFFLIEIEQDLDLEDKHMLDRYVTMSISSISVRSRNSLYRLFSKVPTTVLLIRKIFAPHFNFLKQEKIGLKTVVELEQFKSNLFAFIMHFKEDFQNKLIHNPKLLVKPEFDDKLKLIESLSPQKKLILNRYIDYLVSKLEARAKNVILNLLEEKKSKKNFLILILSPAFNFNELVNVGDKTLSELELFKLDIENYIKEIQNLNDNNLCREFSIVIIKSHFIKINDFYANIFDEVFDSTGKLKLFKLIQILIDTGYIIKRERAEIFWLEFTNHYEKDIIQISEELELTKERIRQIKIKLKDTFETYFGFILNFKIDDLLLYDILTTDNFKVIDYSFIEKINLNESVNFNVNFYCKILHILLEGSFSIIGIEETNINTTITSKKIYELKNKYLISKILCDSFNFISFITDVDSKLSERITETYEFHFEGYLFQFLTTDDTSDIEKIKVVCESILYNEFEIVIDASGYLVFERNTFKQVHEYCYEILEKNSQKMTIAEIQNIFNQQYPDIITTTDSIRGSLNREKEIFIFYGRRSTYGLRKWEQEKENHKGGTIRDIVEEYLTNEEQPKHITEILEYVQKFRDTNKRSVLTNIKVDESNRFAFFKKEYVGITSKTYDEYHFTSIKKETKTNWNDRLFSFKEFREQNKGKLPSSTSANKLERSLYLFLYKTRKSIEKKELSKEKIDLLQSINFPFEDELSTIDDWETKFSDLISFIKTEHSLPKANSHSKIERSLYRFWYYNRKDYLNNQLTQEQLEILKKNNFNFNVKI